ncbi:hypothetical protein [Paracoccus tegillarcae]|uniref:Uncharacterized protein n=1 Tax=Paracoccus tegillarcae TaxID=1529068 RepID=A0A2K9EJ87_9RHOB|nr:hypothetical protein [Paracoccus tegillarcae]AUH35078.1 hypothetical protein CUV01_18365 [Paracoccus tegillarcae]
MRHFIRHILQRLAPPSPIRDALDQPEFHRMTQRELDDLPWPRPIAEGEAEGSVDRQQMALCHAPTELLRCSNDRRIHARVG